MRRVRTWREGGREIGREEGGSEGERGWMSNKKEGREAQKKWKEDTASVRTLNMYRLHYLSLLVHMCIGLNQHTDHVELAFL